MQNSRAVPPTYFSDQAGANFLVQEVTYNSLIKRGVFEDLPDTVIVEMTDTSREDTATLSSTLATRVIEFCRDYGVGSIVFFDADERTISTLCLHHIGSYWTRGIHNQERREIFGRTLL